MGLLPKHERSTAGQLAAYALAAGIPMAAYLATGSPHSYWLDAGEFVEAATLLDIAHPPGHPLAALLGHLFALLPFGPIPLRIALAQATCAAIAAGFLFRAFELTIRALEVRHDRLVIPIALGATWLISGSHAWWFQAVRPEVYALQMMLLAIAIERIITLEVAWPTSDMRPLYVAAIAIGLGLANHHFMAVMMLPALAPTLARVYRARGFRALSFAGMAMGSGLVAYAYLPVRAHTHPPVDLGHPVDLERLWWVVSAEAYQHTSELEQASLIERLLDVAIAVLESVDVWLLVIAIAGLWVLLRAPGVRRLGYVWLALGAFACVGRAWLGHTSNNPDALGYLMPAFAAIGGLAAAFVAAVIAQLGGHTARKPAHLLTALALVSAGLGLAPLKRNRARATLASFHATDDFDDRRIRSLPPRSVVIAYLPQTVFRHWELQATEQSRPDVSLIPMPFLGYPGVLDALIERDPMVQDVLRGYLLDGELGEPHLQSLAARRPLLIEMDVRVPQHLYETIAPTSHGYYEVIDGGATSADMREGGARRAVALERWAQAIGHDIHDAETRNQLLWMHYGDVLYHAHSGLLERARESLSRARALAPEARELRAIEAVLEDPNIEGSIDVTPFLAGPPPSR